MIRLGRTPPLASYLDDLWRRRDFLVTVPLSDLQAQNVNTLFGGVWHVLNPSLLVAVYYFIFGVMLHTNRGIQNFLTFLAIGVFSFNWTQRSVVAGAGSVVANEGLIRSLYFPRSILPISASVRNLFAFLPALVVVIVVALVQGQFPTWRWPILIPIVATQFLFNVGAAFVAARLTSHFRDLQNLLPHLFRVLFYVSGTLYDVNRFVGNATMRTLFALNPMFAFVALERFALMGRPVDPLVWASAFVWTVVLLVGGFFYFRAGEHRYGSG